MTAAIFGLIGVVVGGLLNAGVSAWQARRSQAAAVRVAARLIYFELRGPLLALATDVLEGTYDHKQDMASRGFPTAAWDKYRDLLAGALSDADWAQLVGAYGILEGSPTHTLARTLDPEASHRNDSTQLGDAVLRMQRLGERRRWRLRRSVERS